MKLTKLTAIVTAVVLGSTALGVAGAASAAPTVFPNQDQTPSTTDLDISTLGVDLTAESLTAQATEQNLKPAGGYSSSVYVLPTSKTLTDSPNYISYTAVSNATSSTVYQQVTTNGITGAQTTLAGATIAIKNANVVTLTIPNASVPASPVYVWGTLSDSTSSANADVRVNGQTTGFGPIALDPIITTTTARLSSPTQVHNSTPAVVVAHVEASNGRGTVDVVEGATTIASAPYSGTDVAINLPSSLAFGAHILVAVFHPTVPTAYASSSSALLALNVLSGGIKTTTKLTLTKSTQQFKEKSAKLTIKVSHKPSGKVALYDGTTKIKTLKLKKGKATYTLPKRFAKGKHALSVVFTPTHIDSYAPSVSKTKSLKIK